jgi:uncharacterized protein RhaS with RHS repeats
LNEDPIGFNGGDENLRRYVGNGVVDRVDPNGLMERVITSDNLTFGDFQIRPSPRLGEGRTEYDALTSINFELSEYTIAGIELSFGVDANGKCEARYKATPVGIE